MKENDKHRDRLEKHFKLLAKSYLKICRKQQPKEFFGLRDFYRYSHCDVLSSLYHCEQLCVHSLIKMLYWMVEKTNQPLTMKQLEHAVRRNFGGLDEVDAVGVFQKNIHIAVVNQDVGDPKVIIDYIKMLFLCCRVKNAEIVVTILCIV